jgi:hypothetical protein
MGLGGRPVMAFDEGLDEESGLDDSLGREMEMDWLSPEGCRAGLRDDKDEAGLPGTLY